MDHGLVDRVGGLVGEDARRQARHQLFHLVDPAALHHIVVDEDVLAEELHLIFEVAEEPAHLRDTGVSRIGLKKRLFQDVSLASSCYHNLLTSVTRHTALFHIQI